MKTKWMSETDLSRAFSDKVAEQFSKGLVLLPETMSGSQGDLANVDFTNENGKVYRVRMYNDCIRIDEAFESTKRAIVIEVREYDMKKERIERGEFHSLGNVIWNDHGEVIEKKVYYEFFLGNNSYIKSYISDVEYVERARERRKVKSEIRRKARGVRKNTVITPSKRLVEIVKRVGGYGYGNTKLEMIDRVEKCESGYIIVFIHDSKKKRLYI